jgi:ATP-dependent helicase HrpA
MQTTFNEADWWKDRGDEGFPETLRIAGRTLRLSYRHTPDDPETDGVTCTVKRSDAQVLRLWRSDWLVPGMLGEKLRWHLSALPSQYRRLLAPLEDAADILLPMLKPGDAPFTQALGRAIRERWGFNIPEPTWQTAKLPAHLKMRFRLVDDRSGETLAVTRDLDELLKDASPGATEKTVEKSRVWNFGDIPESVTDKGSAWAAKLYPALRDEGDGVTLKLFADAGAAARTHAGGITRLFALQLGRSFRVPFRRDRLGFEAALYLKNADYTDERIMDDLAFGAVAEAMVRGRPAVRTAAEFNRRLAECRSDLVKTAAEMAMLFRTAAAEAAKISNALEDGRLREETADAISTQLAWLMYRGFPRNVPLERLRCYERYLKGASVRLSRAITNPSGDIKKEALFAPYWERYREAVRPENPGKTNPEALQRYRWMLEEFRISTFAQELRTAESVSPKRLDALWAEVLGH